MAMRSITFDIGDWREVDANGDVGAVAAACGVLGSDTTPVRQATVNETDEIMWAIGNTDIIQCSKSLPADFVGTADVTIRMWVSSGVVGPDPATFTVNTSWDFGAQVTDAVTDSAPSAAIKMYTAAIAAADVPDGADNLTIQLVPAAHGNDAIQLHGIRLEYGPVA
jgi:hypothetical protein